MSVSEAGDCVMHANHALTVTAHQRTRHRVMLYKTLSYIQVELYLQESHIYSGAGKVSEAIIRSSESCSQGRN